MAAIALAALVIGVEVGVSLLRPERAYAVGAPDVVAALTGKWSSDKIAEGLLASTLGALVNGVSYFMRKLAYDGAQYIASGGKGQGALAFQDGFGKYLQNEIGNSVASAVDEFGKPFGLNLCTPPDVNLQIYLQVGIRRLYADPTLAGKGGPQPNCTWQQFSDSWGDLSVESIAESGRDVVSQSFANALRVNQSDFGVALGFAGQVDRLVAQGQVGADRARLEGMGFKSLTDLISGDIKTPATIIQEETKALTAKHQGEITAGQIAGIYGAGMWQVIPSAASVFLNTLVSQVLQNMMTDGLLPSQASVVESGTGDVVREYSGVINKNRFAAANAFNFLFTAVPAQQLDDYALIEEYNNCPDVPGINNCVADAGLLQAVKLSRTGTPLTIQEAMDKTLLREDWPLIPPTREDLNEDLRRCFLKGYCYSNIQKLRKVRILPLGFEVAALKADPDQLQNWTLGNIVRGFEQCAQSGQPDPKFPFCHLIDPNWVIRLPESRCESKVFGPSLLSSNNPARREECVDISTCIAEDSQGQCVGDYGYCLKEKNVWAIEAKSCPAEYGTCTTYINDKDGGLASYLSRTVEYGECTPESVGCRAYSAEQVNGEWVKSGVQFSLAAKRQGRPQALFFNDAAKSYQNQCSPSSEGCGAFYQVLPGGQKGSLLAHDLRKAPDYLYSQCYDMDLATIPVEWPKSQADIAKLDNRPGAESCLNFARACTPDESGCEAFTPQDENSGPAVTGVVGANECAPACVGYDTFKQEASDFEPAKFPLHFVASDGSSCPADYVGCSEFTNIEAAVQGGESLRYYSGIQYCQKPTGQNESTYYSWEGTAKEGYVLKIHKMLPVNQKEREYLLSLQFDGVYASAVDQSFPVGSPAYADDSPEALAAAHDDCNQYNYQIALNNPHDPAAAAANCRALYNDEGTVFYRLSGQTVTVSPLCLTLRKTETNLYPDGNIKTAAMCADRSGFWNGAACERCYKGGQYQAGVCIYSSIESEANQCAGPADDRGRYNGCRAYTGNAASNIEEVVETIDFEPMGQSNDALNQAKKGWLAGAVKPESMTVGQYSLEVNVNEADYLLPAGTLRPGVWYELRFWARGQNQVLDVGLAQGGTVVNTFTINPVTGDTLLASIGPAWQAYKLGPIEFTGSADSDVLVRFKRGAVGTGPVGPYYLDNVGLTKLDETTPLIKNSWRRQVDYPAEGQTASADVDLACDQNPTDAFPGEALGCRAYKNSDGSPVFATGFARLCRPAAVGCRPLVDTFNTVETDDEALAGAFNLWCAGAAGKKCELKTASGNAVLGACDVPLGASGCYIARSSALEVTDFPAAGIVTSTVIVPADTPASAPVYLTDSKDYRCTESERGCQKVALEDQLLPEIGPSSSAFSETMVKNDPALYGQVLCMQEQLGCGAYKANSEIVYFKDPKVTGNRLCKYRTTEINGQTYTGWFMDGVGRCGAGGPLCRSSAECQNSEQCSDIDLVPCYSGYLAEGQYGIWSNKTPAYQGFVGVCESQYNQCTELVDPADSSGGNPDGKPYYVILDQKAKNKAQACNQQVSLKDGCVLFDKTDEPTKLYDSAATYAAAENEDPKYGPTAPSTAGNLDTNIILKAARNRACSEWLACRDSVRVIGSNGQPRNICAQYKSCQASANGGACSDWTEFDKVDLFPLTEQEYISRDTSWFGRDYSGYSLFNKYQINNLSYLSDADTGINYLAYEVPPAFFSPSSPAVGQGCSGKPDWSGKCGLDGGGRCYKGKCYYPLDGKFPNGIDQKNEALLELEPGTCKAFPEQISPYPDSYSVEADTYEPLDPAYLARREYRQKRSGYESANLCQSGNCSCEYKKVTYKNSQVDYWDRSVVKYPPGICEGGDYDGRGCSEDKDCEKQDKGVLVSAGTCSRVRDIERRLGLRGFCLEYDLSRPLNKDAGEYACLTWLPVDTSATSLDQFNNFSDAGYDPAFDAVTVSSDGTKSSNGVIYCAEATGNSLGAYDANAFVAIDSSCTESPFKCNSYLYQTLFNKHGDYIAGGGFYGATGVQSQACYAWSCSPGIFYFKGLNLQTPIPAPGAGITEDEYRKKVYSLMQMWAWAGGMYGNGLSSILSQNGGYAWQPSGGMPAPKSLGEYENDEEDSQLFLPDDLKYPNAVVTFVSGHYYRNYLFTSIERYEKGGCGSAGGFSGSCGKLYYSHQPLWVGVGDFDGDVQNFFQPGLYQDYASDYRQIESEIKALHFGPVMGPVRMAKVLTIDFDKLASKEFLSKTTPNGLKYKVQLDVDSDKNVVTFRLRADDGPTAGETKYAAYAFAHNSAPTADFFAGKSAEVFLQKKFEELAGDTSGGNWYQDVQNAWAPTQGALGFYSVTVGFGQNGEKNFWEEHGLLNSDSAGLVNHIFQHGDKFATFYLAEVMELKPRCTAFVQVYTDTPAADGTTDKAWTNRVWERASEIWKTPPTPALTRGTPLVSYGSTNLAATHLLKSNWPEVLRRYVFTDPQYEGAFYACGGPVLEPKGEFAKVFKEGSIGKTSPGDGQMGLWTFYKCYQNSGTVYDSIPNGIATKVVSGQVKFDYFNTPGMDYLRQLFKKSFRTIEHDAVNSTWKESTADFGNDNEPDLIPPQIYSLDPSCFLTTDKVIRCHAAESNNVTIDRRNFTTADYDGNGQADEDLDFDQIPDPIISKRFYTAKLQFFAFADKNRLPIRRVKVDWGDGTVFNEDRYGRYRNSKPFCMASDDQENPDIGECKNSPQLTCENDSDCPGADTCQIGAIARNFGNSPRACTEGAFEFIHGYTCSQIDIDLNATYVKAFEALTASEQKWLNQLGYSQDKNPKVCVFEPRVQVLDNWGWCSGMCDVDYNKDGKLDLKDGCYQDKIFACNKDSNTWIKYNGRIIVIPK